MSSSDSERPIRHLRTKRRNRFSPERKERLAWAAVHLTPLGVGVLLSTFQYLNVTTWERDDTAYAFASTALGALVSALLWAITELMRRQRARDHNRHIKAVREAMSVIPESQLVRGIVGDQPERFLEYLAIERRVYEQGVRYLKEDHAWPLSTPRAYEAIVYFLREAQHLRIVDHDIRRWYELLDEPDQRHTSTTFNFSRHILSVTEEAIKDGSLKSYRRIFMLNPNLECNLDVLKDACALDGENDPAKVDSVWKSLSKPVRVLLTLWDFEHRLAQVHGLGNFETRVLWWKQNLQHGTLSDQINQFEDIVLVDNLVCFHETLHCRNQLSVTTSFTTKSYLHTHGEHVESTPAFFEKLWDKAEKWDKIDQKEWSRRIPATYQVVN